MAKRQRTASLTLERVGRGSPESGKKVERSARPDFLSADGDSDLMSTGAARFAQARLPLAEEIAHAFSEAAEENPRRALAWEERCCSKQFKHLTLREAELIRLEEGNCVLMSWIVCRMR